MPVLMTGTQGSSPVGAMPEMAGEDVRLHDAVEYWESAQSALAHTGLLKAAMGMLPDEAKRIVDIDIRSYSEKEQHFDVRE